MKKLIDEFKKFIMRGNVIDLAVGVVMGNAFSKIVSSLVNDIMMPIIGIIIGSSTLNFHSGLMVEEYPVQLEIKCMREPT